MSRHANLALAVATAATALQLAASFDNIAGYTPVSNVESHSLLDLDMSDMEDGADLQTTAGFLAAYTAYSEGGNR